MKQLELTAEGFGLEHRRAEAAVAAEQILRLGYTLAPLLAGLDKFGNRLVVWEDYLSPSIARLVPMKPATLMKVVGVVEVAAGLLVAVRPALGSKVVAAWLSGIVGNLVLHPRRYLDIALRDVGLALGALALSKLSSAPLRARRDPWRQPALTTSGAVPMPQRLFPSLEDEPHR